SHGELGDRAPHRLLPRRHPAQHGRGRGMRLRPPRRVLPRDAGSRRVPAALAVRGMVPVARSHRRARGAHARRSAGGAGHAVSNLDDLIASAGPDLAAHATPNPGPARFPLPDADGRAYVLEAVYEAYLLHYGESRAFV